MSTYRVAKKRVPVRVQLSGKPFEADVFLALTHLGVNETVLELLNGRDAFLSSETRQGYLCLAVSAIRAVWAQSDVGAPPEVVTPNELHVGIELDSGERFEGDLRFVAEPDQLRMIDFLNHSGPFFPLFQGDDVVLVARRHVSRVWLSAEAPASRAPRARTAPRRARRSAGGRAQR